MFILAAWIHCFVYISKGLVTRGYIHFAFIIVVSESMLLQVVQVVLLLVVILVIGFVFCQNCINDRSLLPQQTQMVIRDITAYVIWIRHANLKDRKQLIQAILLRSQCDNIPHILSYT